MEIPVIKVRQWLPEWENVRFSKTEYRAKPRPEFYIFSISAKKLRQLSDVRRRNLQEREFNKPDCNIQRQHDPKRSDEIRRFVKWGYPWSSLSKVQREDEQYKDLQKPGWLPTSIVVNILEEGDVRNDMKVEEDDLLKISEDGNSLIFPPRFDEFWRPSKLAPVEVIDGQHRLWAFDESISDDMELPVVAFVGLDISWQAYLFWSINIKPKKINPSLAYDLYPLLRTQDWLSGFSGPVVYREARSQEIVEILWGCEVSPWHGRIDMLGDIGKKKGVVSQAAWIKTLLATFMRAWDSPDSKLGGFYGVAQQGEAVIPWNRKQQAAFLIFLGSALKKAIRLKTDVPWISSINNGQLQDLSTPGFESKESLLATDQGIRGLLDVANLVLCSLYSELKESYFSWRYDEVGEGGCEDIDALIASLEKSKLAFAEMTMRLMDLLAEFDWRGYNAQFAADEENEKMRKAGFRGSGGYKLIRNELLKHIRQRVGGGDLKIAIDRISSIMEL